MSNKTGRTQIRIVQAVSAMLMGKTVLHVSGTSGAARAAMRYAKDWLYANGWQDQGVALLTADNSTLTISFGRGELKFSCMEKAQGLRYATVMNDHSVDECIATQASKAEQEADKNTIAKLMHKHQWGNIEGYGVQFPGGMHQRAKLWLNLVKRTAE